MARILWTKWQRRHIEKRHGITKKMLSEAWHDDGREDLEEHEHENGTFFVSYGLTRKDVGIEMVWRWQEGKVGVVWAITAYDPEADEEE